MAATYTNPETDPVAEGDLAAHIATAPAHGGDLAGDARPPETHTHPIDEIVALQAALDDKQDASTAATDTELADVQSAVDDEAATRASADNDLAEDVAAAQTVADAALPRAGGTMTGKIVLDGDPTSSLHAATRQYVLAQINALINGAPSTLDTLKEIADQLGSDESALSALTSTVAGKLSSASNLSDLTNAVQARSNLGLGNAATKDTGSSSSQVAAGDDSRFPTTGQKNALAGLHGTPGTGNEYRDQAEHRGSGHSGQSLSSRRRNHHKRSYTDCA
jgi:hypothetical protein